MATQQIHRLSYKRLEKNLRRIAHDFRWAISKYRFQKKLQTIESPADETRDIILFFAPEAGVKPLFLRMCYVARTLKELGHEVRIARCFQLYRQCPVKISNRNGRPRKRSELEQCLQCADYSARVLKHFELQSIDLRYFKTEAINQRIDRESASLPENLFEYEYESIGFGKLSVSNITLRNKISDQKRMLVEYRDIWIDHIKEDLLTYMLAEEICRLMPIKAMVHFSNYSMFTAASLAARRQSIPSYQLTSPGHKDVDFQRVNIYPDPELHARNEICDDWSQWRDKPLDRLRITEITDDLIGRLVATGVYGYSPAKTLRDGFSLHSQMELSPEKKLIVAYTSSLDEQLGVRFAYDAWERNIPIQPQPFADQIDWLQSLTNFVGNRKDLQLVVRVHPREGANHRDSVISDHLHLLQTHFQKTYANCRFVWPGDAISSYDLAEIADVALTSWSTIGLELARLGIPVLAAFNWWYVPRPVNDFNEWSSNADGYYQKLDALLGKQRGCLQRIAKAFRWYNLINLETGLDFSDVVPAVGHGKMMRFAMPGEAKCVEAAIVHNRKIWEMNLQRRVDRQYSGIECEETLALQQSLRRLIHYICAGQDSPEDRPLKILQQPATQWRPDHKLVKERTLRMDGKNIEYCSGRNRWRRYSPLVSRIGELCKIANEVEQRKAA
jgi:hypothetical protein